MLLSVDRVLFSSVIVERRFLRDPSLNVFLLGDFNNGAVAILRLSSSSKYLSISSSTSLSLLSMFVAVSLLFPFRATCSSSYLICVHVSV